MTENEQEWKTRRDRIDVKLKKAGWNVKDHAKVLEEIDSKNSIFPHDIKYKSDTLSEEVEKYYKEFEQQEPVETNLGFIQTQRSVKNRVLPRMDYILDKLEDQIDRISKQQKKDGTVDMVRYETLKTRILKLMSDVLQQKASIEITPTLDISLENYIKEKQQGRLRVKSPKSGQIFENYSK